MPLGCLEYTITGSPSPSGPLEACPNPGYLTGETGETAPFREDCLRGFLVGLINGGDWYCTLGGRGGALVRSIANVECVGGAEFGEMTFI